MTLARTTRSGPVHVVVSGRTICGGAAAAFPAAGDCTCLQCIRSLEKRRRVLEERA